MTIYSIAEEAGVSASTVSRVINNKPGVNPETRKKIQELLERRHYHPDVAARGLVSGDTRIIGILVADIRNTHYTEGAYYIERAMSQSGYNSLIFNTGNDAPSIRKSVESLMCRKPAAVAMIGSTFQTGAVEEIIRDYLRDTPVVIANGILDLPNVYGVVSDEEQGVENCIRYLTKRGKKKIAFINDADTASNRSKLRGYTKGIRENIGDRCEPIVVNMESNNSRADSINATRQLLDQYGDVDGIIYASDFIAAAGLTALRERGKRIPEDIAVIGINNSAYAEISYPRLTSLDNKLARVSEICARTIRAVLEGEDVPHTRKIYSDIVPREST